MRQAWTERPTPVAPQPPAAGAARFGGDRPIAGYGYRVAAYLFDAGLALAVGFVVAFAAGGREQWQAGNSDTYLILGAVCTWLLATTVATGIFKGQTLGKRLAGTRVIGPGGPADVGTSVLRDQLARLLYFVPLFGLVDVVWAAADGNHQSLRDKMVGTYVVRDGGTTGRAWLVSLAAAALLAVWIGGTSALDAGAGNEPGKGYTKAERAAFVHSCHDSGLSRKRCNCLFSYISARVSHDEFSSIDSDDPRDWPRHMRSVSEDATDACVGGGGQPSSPLETTESASASPRNLATS